MPKLKERVRRTLVEERQAQILAAAMKVFAKRGFERATVADIAKEAGIAEGSIYNYFKSKDDLLGHIPRLALQPASQTLERLMETPPAQLIPEQALTQIAQYIVTFFRENAPFIRVMLSSVPSISASARSAWVEHGILYVSSQLETVFEHLVAEGVFRADLNPRLAPRIFVGMFFPTLLLREIIRAQDFADVAYDDIITVAVKIFLHGALPPEPITPPSPAPEKKAQGRKRA